MTSKMYTDNNTTTSRLQDFGGPSSGQSVPDLVPCVQPETRAFLIEIACSCENLVRAAERGELCLGTPEMASREVMLIVQQKAGEYACWGVRSVAEIPPLGSRWRLSDAPRNGGRQQIGC